MNNIRLYAQRQGTDSSQLAIEENLYLDYLCDVKVHSNMEMYSVLTHVCLTNRISICIENSQAPAK